jgi:hypothetical protein
MFYAQTSTFGLTAARTAVSPDLPHQHHSQRSHPNLRSQ